MVSREEAEERRGGIPAPLRKKDGDRSVPAPVSLFFDDLLDASRATAPNLLSALVAELTAA